MSSYGLSMYPPLKTEWPSPAKCPCVVPSFCIYCSIPGMNRTIFTSVKVTVMGYAPEEEILFKFAMEMI